MPLSIFRKLAICILTAIARFHEIGMSHSDIKPENVMISEGEFIVIDLGSMCLNGDAAREYTEGYCLDAAMHFLTPEFDLNCAAVTFARCCIPGFKVDRGMTKKRFSDIIDEAITSEVLSIIYRADS